MRVKSIVNLGKPQEKVYNLRIRCNDEYNHNYFANGVCVSNCHHATSASIKNVLDKCTNLQYSMGVTGTFPKEDDIANLYLQTYIGPNVYQLSSDSLINTEKAACPIYVVFQNMDWATIDEKKQLWLSRCQKDANPDDMTIGNQLLKQECEFVNNSYTRMKYIADMAIKMAHNTLVLFGDVKGGYGKSIADYIKENSDKHVYYVDGTTPPQNRDVYKELCENDTEGRTVLVASIKTFGEGIDLCNIWSIFLVNSAKSERIVRQICGRGLRKYEGKDKTILYDFIDNLKYTETGKYNDNYMWKHYLERKKIYREQNFPTYEQKISFS